jgi:hypothetical protein
MTGAVDNLSLNAAVDAAIDACGGDARAAVRALIVANNYLEAEVKRLAQAVSAGFARGQATRRNEQSKLPRLAEEPADFCQDIEGRFPYFVDLVPPEDGFPDAVEDQIAGFLDPIGGKYDQFVDLRGEELSVRYCFARKRDAEAFHAAFASAALKSRFRQAG